MTKEVGLSSGIITLEEFNFTHAVFIYEGILNPDSLIAGYNKCYQYMDLENHPGKFTF